MYRIGGQFCSTEDIILKIFLILANKKLILFNVKLSVIENATFNILKKREKKEKKGNREQRGAR
jgi:hypothetical protein